MAKINTLSTFTKAGVSGEGGSGKKYLVKLTDVDQNSVEFYTQEKIGITFFPEYTSMGSTLPIVGNILSSIEGLGSFMDSPLLFGGLTSQLTYKGASHISLAFKLLCIDEDGDDKKSPIAISKLLAKWCQPRSFAKGMADTAKSIYSGVDKMDMPNIADLGGFSSAGGVVDTLANFSDVLTNSLSDKFTSLSTKRLTLNLGNTITIRDVVITSADISFSKEFTKKGPLYAEVSLTVKTLRTLDEEQAQSMFVANNPRVTEGKNIAQI